MPKLLDSDCYRCEACSRQMVCGPDCPEPRDDLRHRHPACPEHNPPPTEDERDEYGWRLA